MAALNFAALAARFPPVGSVYQWAKQLTPGFGGWVAGWMMLLGRVVALAAATIALQIVLPSAWSGFQMVGGDTSVTSPTGATNAVLRALRVSGIGGLTVVVFSLMAAPNFTNGQLAGQGLQYVITAVFGGTVGPIVLADVAIAVIVCTLTIQTGTIRLFSTIAATSVVIVYLAYLLVRGPLLGNRFRKRVPAAQPGWFSLGRWAIPVNAVAVLYGLAMIVNIAWPRAEIYDLGGTGSRWMLFFPFEYMAAALVIGWLSWLRLRSAPPAPATY
jgi:hypothetical protein